MQARLEEVLLQLVRWLHEQTGDRVLTMAGGVALNCVANSRLAARGTVRDGLGAAGRRATPGPRSAARCTSAAAAGERAAPMAGADLGRGWTDAELAAWLDTARWPYERPADLAGAVAEVLAGDGVVGWFAGRSEYGPRALGHRSLLANPGRRETLTKLNDVKGREQFRPVAPMIRLDRAAEVFDGPAALAVHAVRAPGPAALAGPDPGRGARRRHGAGADRRPRAGAGGGRPARPRSSGGPGCRAW